MKKIFNYIVIFVILLIPFIYSFFYLKAYWNPYGKGNIDNIPVAIINEDKGEKGINLINSLKTSGKLKIKKVAKENAEDGLYSGKYYAIIKIPNTFTEDLESASNIEKTHATITYSPNQKSNFLASQIINSVVNAVEKKLDNEVNSTIVTKLSDNLKETPKKLEKVSEGFENLKLGTIQLQNGSNKLETGTNMLNNNYSKFNSAISGVNSGISKIANGSEKIKNGLRNAEESTKKMKNAIDSKIEEVKADESDALTEEQTNQIGEAAKQKVTENEQYIKEKALNEIRQNSVYIAISDGITAIETNYINKGITTKEACKSLTSPEQTDNCIDNLNRYSYLQEEKQIMENVATTSAYSTAQSISSDTAKNVAYEVGNKIKKITSEKTIAELSDLSNNIGMLTNGINGLYNGATELESGANTLHSGTDVLSNSSNTIKNSLKNLNNGASSLNNGLNTLNVSITQGKDNIDYSIENTKSSLKKLETLPEYSKNPVRIKTKEINKVDTYGTAFTPFFMSIGLWVGSLMMYIILYFDKEERFGLLGNNSNKRVKQMLAYHSLITISAVLLGSLLHVLLDLNITNVLLYYISLVLIGNMFMGIIEFLIIAFKDFGKFIALILLVLQLAAAGGTFPIETVSKEFRWMNNYLPMTYTVNLLREMLIKIDDNLLTKNMVIIATTCAFFFILNILIARLKQNKQEI